MYRQVSFGLRFENLHFLISHKRFRLPGIGFELSWDLRLSLYMPA